jgi:hypothetical protein
VTFGAVHARSKQAEGTFGRQRRRLIGEYRQSGRGEVAGRVIEAATRIGGGDDDGPGARTVPTGVQFFRPPRRQLQMRDLVRVRVRVRGAVECFAHCVGEDRFERLAGAIGDDDLRLPDPDAADQLPQQLGVSPAAVEAIPGGQQFGFTGAGCVLGEWELPERLAGGPAGATVGGRPAERFRRRFGGGRGRVRCRDAQGRRQVAIVAAHRGDCFQRKPGGTSVNEQRGRPLAAATLRGPGPAAVGRAEDRAQVADRPAVLVVAELDRVERHRLARGQGLPALAEVAAMKDERSGPADRPDVRPAQRNAVEVAAGGHVGRQSQIGERPLGAAAIAADQNQSALSHGDGPLSLDFHVERTAAAELVDFGGGENAFAEHAEPAPGACQ